MDLIWFKIEFGFENEMEKDLEIGRKLFSPQFGLKAQPPLSAGPTHSLLSPLLPGPAPFLPAWPSKTSRSSVTVQAHALSHTPTFPSHSHCQHRPMHQPHLPPPVVSCPNSAAAAREFASILSPPCLARHAFTPLNSSQARAAPFPTLIPSRAAAVEP